MTSATDDSALVRWRLPTFGAAGVVSLTDVDDDDRDLDEHGGGSAPANAVYDPESKLADAAEQARQRGYEDGLRAGQAAVETAAAAERAARSAQVQHIETQFAALAADTSRQIAEQVTAIIVALVEAITDHVLATDPTVVHAVVDRALTELREPLERAVLSLSPDDAAEFHGVDGLRVRSDPQLQRGEIRLDGQLGHIEFNAHERLASALSAVRVGLSDAAESAPL